MLNPLVIPQRLVCKNFIQINEKVDSSSNGNYIPAWNNAYETMMLENHYQTSLDNPKPPKEQPRFIIGMLLLRNRDASLVEATWEFIIDFDLTVGVTNGVTGYYGRHETYPEANYMYPNIQMGTFDESLINMDKDQRTLYGLHKLKKHDNKKLPVQNRPVLPNGKPVDKSIEGEEPKKVEATKHQYIY